jgi:hypothetical protein
MPTSTVVVSRRDDLQMRILERRSHSANLVSQSASIEVFATQRSLIILVVYDLSFFHVLESLWSSLTL